MTVIDNHLATSYKTHSRCVWLTFHKGHDETNALAQVTSLRM